MFNVSIKTKSQQYYYGIFNKQNFPLQHNNILLLASSYALLTLLK